MNDQKSNDQSPCHLVVHEHLGYPEDLSLPEDAIYI